MGGTGDDAVDAVGGQGGRVASWSCAADQVASCPLPAVSTMSGLSAKFVRDAAWFLEAPPWRYSSMVLRMEAAHGGPGPHLIVVLGRQAICGEPAEHAAQTYSGRGRNQRGETIRDISGSLSLGGIASGWDAGAVESTNTRPATSVG